MQTFPVAGVRRYAERRGRHLRPSARTSRVESRTASESHVETGPRHHTPRLVRLVSP